MVIQGYRLKIGDLIIVPVSGPPVTHDIGIVLELEDRYDFDAAQHCWVQWTMGVDKQSRFLRHKTSNIIYQVAIGQWEVVQQEKENV